jgi:hypothetical protein
MLAWNRNHESGKSQEVLLHDEIQDAHSDAWKSLEAYIEKVDAEGRDELNPMDGIGPEKWEQIVTLPRSIGRLQSGRFLMLYGSHLVRIPPEIAEMTNLEGLDPYTSYCLHWFPCETIRCNKLKRSRVSTRALYGNYKYRAPFPRLPSMSADLKPVSCRVCRRPFTKHGPSQVWISLRVATDVLPLLVHACSTEMHPTASQSRGWLCVGAASGRIGSHATDEPNMSLTGPLLTICSVSGFRTQTFSEHFPGE